MLVLTRRKGESIIIGDDIIITVIEITHDQVRFGIEAPWDVRINYKEYREAMNKKSPQKPPSNT